MSKIWGPKLWHLMHNISYSYKLKPSITEKNDYLNFYLSIYDLIPCPICKKFYGDFLLKIDKNKLVFNKFTLINKINLLHNLVNKKLGKRIHYPKNIDYICKLNKLIISEILEIIYNSNQLNYYSLIKFFYYFIQVYPDYRKRLFLNKFYINHYKVKSGALIIKNELIRVIKLV